MKNNFLFVILFIFSSFSLAQSIPTAGAYTTDESEYFVSGMKPNEALDRVNLLLCYLSNTKPLTFLNKGNYVSTIYEEDCAFKGSSSGKDNANKNSGSSSSGTARTGKQGNTTFSTMVQTETTDPMLGKVWIQLKKEKGGSAGSSATSVAGGDGGKGGDGLPFDATVYLKYSQTSSPTSTSKLGDFTMAYSLYADAHDVAGTMGLSQSGLTELDMDGKTQKEKIEAQNFSMGFGFISANGQTIKFKESILGLEDISITYSATGAKGIYSSETWDQTYAISSGNGMVTTYHAFIINDASDFYCEKLISVKAMDNSSLNAMYDFDSADSEMGASEGTQPTFNNVTISNTGQSTAEKCFSTKKSEAKRNVHQYGVYNSDGSRVGATSGPFPIRAENASGDDYYGWADYWGVWVDSYGREAENINPTSLTWKRDDGKTSGSCQSSCSLSSQYVEVTKFQTSYRSLDSIDNLKLSFQPGYDFENAAKWAHANILNTTSRNGGTACAYSHFEDVSNNVCFANYEGYWDADNDQIVITHGLKWSKTYANPPSSPLVDITDINISASNYVSIMNYGDAAYPISLWTYSPDTWERFQIPGPAFISSNHASVSAGIGIMNKKISYISPAELATDIGSNSLICINQCLDPALLNARYSAVADALSNATTSDDGMASSILNSVYDGDAHTYHDIGSGNMEFYDGVTDSYKTQYVVSGGKIWFEDANSANNEMTITSATNTKLAAAAIKQEQPKDYLMGNLRVKTPGYDASTSANEVQYIGWSASTGFLVPSNDISSIECSKDGSGDYLSYDADHPRYNGNATLMNATRHCYSSYSQGGPSTYYEVRVMLAGKYELSEGGTKVAINQPATLDFDPSSLSSTLKTAGGISTADAEKVYKLHFGGFGDLHGVPGGVFNVCTNEDMGEYFYGSWDESCHKWASKFIIPDGATVVDKKNTSTTSDDATYFIRAIKGEEYLTAITGSALSALATRDYTSLTASDLGTVLASASSLIDVGPNGETANYIGTVPTTLLNNGDPSVLMGEVIVAP